MPEFPSSRLVIGMKEVAPGGPVRRTGRDPGVIVPALIEIIVVAVGACRPDHLVDRVGDGLKAGFTGCKPILDDLPVVDVLRGAVPLDDRAGRVPAREGAAARPADPSVAHQHAMLDVVWLTRAEGMAPGVQRPLAVVGMHAVRPAVAEPRGTGPVQPSPRHMIEPAVGTRRPGDLRIELDRMAIMVLAFMQRVEPGARLILSPPASQRGMGEADNVVGWKGLSRNVTLPSNSR